MEVFGFTWKKTEFWFVLAPYVSCACLNMYMQMHYQSGSHYSLIVNCTRTRTPDTYTRMNFLQRTISLVCNQIIVFICFLTYKKMQITSPNSKSLANSGQTCISAVRIFWTWHTHCVTGLTQSRLITRIIDIYICEINSENCPFFFKFISILEEESPRTPESWDLFFTWKCQEHLLKFFNKSNFLF